VPIFSLTGIVPEEAVWVWRSNCEVKGVLLLMP